MSVSNMDVSQLLSLMVKALTEIAIGQPAQLVAEAATRAASSIVTNASHPGNAASALLTCATIFIEDAKYQEVNNFYH